jgi:hypothetical protein
MPTFWAELAERFNLQIVYAFGSRAGDLIPLERERIALIMDSEL